MPNINLIQGLQTVEDFENTSAPPMVYEIGNIGLGNVGINTAGPIQGTRCATGTTTAHLAPTYFNGVAVALSTPLDLSGPDTYLWLWAAMIKPLMDHLGLQSEGGLTIRLYSGTINVDGDLASDATNTYRGYAVAGRDTLVQGWNRLIINPANMTPFDSGNNGDVFDLSAITMVGFIAKKTIAGFVGYGYHMMLDVLHIGRGINFYSSASSIGDKVTLADIYAYTETQDRAWGIVNYYKGVYYLNGEIKIGAATLNCFFSISNEVVVFDSQSNYDGANYQSSLNNALHGIVGVAGSTTDITISGSIIESAEYGKFLLDFSATGVALSFTNNTTNSANSIKFGLGQTVDGKFDKCGQIAPGAANFSNATISGYTGIDGALFWPDTSNISSCSLVDNDRAIEITQTTNQVFDAMTFANNTYDSHLNNGGVDVEIERFDGSNPTTYIATGGGTITYTDPTIRITISNPNLADGTRARLYNMTQAVELDNLLISGGTGYSISLNVVTGSTVEMGDILRLTTMYSSGTTYYNETDESVVVGSSDITMTATQSVNNILTGYGIDGSLQTDFTTDYPNVEIDINSGDTTRQQLLCWLGYIVTTADGIREFFGAVTHEDAGNAKIITAVVDLHIDYVGTGNARFTDDMRLYRDDRTTIFSGAGDNFYADSGKIYVAEIGVSGLTPDESNLLSSLGPAIKDVKIDTELISAIENGRWLIQNNQQIFFKPDNVTEICRFNLLDASGSPTETGVYERVRV